jgi:hypothetical protein
VYDLDPARTATVQYTPRQWVRLLLDPRAHLLTDHAERHVRLMLGYSEDYPDDKIAVSATTREAAFIAAQMRDLETRGY